MADKYRSDKIDSALRAFLYMLQKKCSEIDMASDCCTILESVFSTEGGQKVFICSAVGGTNEKLLLCVLCGSVVKNWLAFAVCRCDLFEDSLGLSGAVKIFVES